jgi:hypothetical protein
MDEPIAGKQFPWEQITGYFLRLESLIAYTPVTGEKVGRAQLGSFGLVRAELPNPDVEPQQRIVVLPVENKSDYKSLYRAHLDSGIKEGTNELVLMFENRGGFFGGRKPSFHVAAYPVGTWNDFFKSVENYTSDQFKWPKALFLYQPSNTIVFPASSNLFSS